MKSCSCTFHEDRDCVLVSPCVSSTKHSPKCNKCSAEILQQDCPATRGLASVCVLTWSSLLSTAPQVLNTSSPAQQAEHEAKASSAISIDESQPTTNIQIRLADGGRLVQKFNHSHRCLVLSGLAYCRRVPETPTDGEKQGAVLPPKH